MKTKLVVKKRCEYEADLVIVDSDGFTVAVLLASGFSNSDKLKEMATLFANAPQASEEIMILRSCVDAIEGNLESGRQSQSRIKYHDY